jgi:hypothetical protein
LKKQFFVLVIIALISILSFAIINNYDGMTLINAQQQTIIDSDNNSDNTNIINLENIPTKKVRVGDIDISYKAFGKGDPILLIMGY